MVLLGVNIDHVATLRNARQETYPDPVEAALLAERHGADGITAHLREDRRHIRDDDIVALRQKIKTRLNLEMANTEEMIAIALKTKPDMVTLVPERREEVTTEGGLNVLTHLGTLQKTVETLQSNGVNVSLFIDPDEEQVEASLQTGARLVEFHTGRYCQAFQGDPALLGKAKNELHALIASAGLAHRKGLIVNAGHGLTVNNVRPILQMPGLHELNIGHSIIAHAVMVGLPEAISQMKAALTAT